MATMTSSFHQPDANFTDASDHATPTRNGSASQELIHEDEPGRNGVTSNGATANVRAAEDPLEAMDNLEDAIEEVDQSLPTVAEDNNHASSTRSSSFNHDPEPVRTPLKAATNANETPKRNSVAMKTPASSTKRYSKPTPTPSHGRVGSRTDSGLRRNSPTKTADNENRPPQGPKLAVHKPAFVPAKSSKPATHPTFELPGEAISRRKREQIEERRRKEEEELQQRRTFKARGIKYDSGQPAGVRETASSRARANRMSQVIDPQTMTPQRKLSTPSSAGRNSRASAENGGSSVPASSTSPSSGTTRSPKSPGAPLSTTAGTTGSAATKKTGATQSTRGKEIFRRERAEREERREREEAAKRARAEAADRSRQLGRAFAERQRQKAAAAPAAKP